MWAHRTYWHNITLSLQGIKPGASHTCMCMQITWGFCENVDPDSVGLGWDPRLCIIFLLCDADTVGLWAGVPNSWARTGTSHRPVRNSAPQQVSGMRAAPHRWHYLLSSASCQIRDCIRSVNPIVNCLCEGSRLS